MKLYRGNRVEELARVLADVLRGSPRAPLEREVIVVQSRGMERWLSLTLAESLGVWLGADFPFPRAFLDQIIGRLLGADDPPVFTRESLTWCVAAELATASSRPDLDEPALLLGTDPTARELVSLAGRIGDLFDQYALYRPELVLDWERGGGDDWQACLWRAVVARLRERHGAAAGAALHVAGRRQRVYERLQTLATLPSGLPRRVSLFGIASLPPLYLELFAALGQRIEVNLFVLAPSREHVAEIRSPREILGELSAADGLDAEALHLVEGNPLLARLGRQHRDLARVLDAAGDTAQATEERFVEPGTGTLLHAVQHDLLHLLHRRPPAPGSPAADPLAPAPLCIADADRSLEFHSCHGPLREVEVLHERLWAAFEADPSLEPHEVIVLAPRIERYVAALDAVFGDDTGTFAPIPYRIADRSPSDASPVVAALLELLAVLSGRFTLGEVVALLESPPVRDRFGIEPEAAPRLVELLRRAGVRWGVNGDDRVRAGAPPSEANTWRFGLARLLLGTAMPEPTVAPPTVAEPTVAALTIAEPGDHHGEATGPLFAGVAALAVDEPELVGRAAELLATLVSWRERLRDPRPLADYPALLGALVRELCAVPPTSAADVQLVRDVAGALGTAAAAAGFTTPVPLDVFRELVADRLPEVAAGAGFLSGGVTCSALLPMRSVPFRIVCLLGMNDGEFPRAQRHTSFDRIAAEPRPGDRSLRQEDENLFLEVLLSARDRLLVTYVGRSMHDDTVRAPSPVVTELIEVLDEAFAVAECGDPPAPPLPPAGVGTRRIVDHPIQRFSPRRFAEGAQTFDAEAAAGARALASPPRPRPRFLPLPLPARAADELTLDELVEALTSPARALLRGRLGVELREAEVSIDDGDPLELDGLERWGLGSDLLALARTDPGALGDGRAWALERARGVLPAGNVGRAAFDDVAKEVVALVQAAAPFSVGAPLEALPFTLEVGARRLVGSLDACWGEAQLTVQFSRAGAATELAAWCRHLVLQVLADRGAATGKRRTVVINRDTSGCGVRVLTFRALEPGQARAHLAELVALAELADRAPVPFFPRAARVYAGTLRRRRAGTEADALAAARAEFELTGEHAPAGEGTDPYVAWLWGDVDPLASTPGRYGATTDAPVPDFATLAVRIFAPLLAAGAEGEDDTDPTEAAP